MRARWRSFGSDVATLFSAKDPRLSKRVKYEVGAATAYLLLPIEVIPDFVPGSASRSTWWAMRRLLARTSCEYWRGTDKALPQGAVAAAQLLGVLAFGALAPPRSAKTSM